MDRRRLLIMIKVGFQKKVMKLLLCNNIVVEKISLFLKVMSNLMVEIKIIFYSFIKYIHLETFAFDSQRHQDYPFALALYINGLIDSRISVCCEYKHKRNVPLGGPHGLFAISDVQKVKPCRRSVNLIY